MNTGLKILIIIIVVILIVILTIILIAAILIGFIIYNNTYKYVDLSKNDLIKLPDDELIQLVYHRTLDLQQRGQTEKEFVNSLEAENKVVYVCTTYLYEIENGGLCQYLINSSKYTAPYLIDSLDYIKAYKMQDLVEDFFDDNQLDYENLEQFYNNPDKDYMEYYKMYPFEAFDDKFSEYRDEEEYYYLLAEYIRSNIDDIAE